MLIKQKSNYVTQRKSVKLFLFGAIAAMGLSSTAFANDLEVAERIDVTVKVADLQSENGIEKVYSDFARAARSACQPSSSFGYSKSTIKACEADLMEQFIADLGDAKVAKLHAVKAG